jgi:hypothetical protein
MSGLPKKNTPIEALGPVLRVTFYFYYRYLRNQQKKTQNIVTDVVAIGTAT